MGRFGVLVEAVVLTLNNPELGSAKSEDQGFQVCPASKFLLLRWPQHYTFGSQNHRDQQWFDPILDSRHPLCITPLAEPSDLVSAFPLANDEFVPNAPLSQCVVEGGFASGYLLPHLHHPDGPRIFRCRRGILSTKPAIPHGGKQTTPTMEGLCPNSQTTSPRGKKESEALEAPVFSGRFIPNNHAPLGGAALVGRQLDTIQTVVARLGGNGFLINRSRSPHLYQANNRVSTSKRVIWAIE